MIVPDLAIYIELNVAHAPFHHATGHDAAAGIGISNFVSDPVSFQRGCGFLIDVEHVGRLQLHAGGQFVTINPRIQLEVVRPFLTMNLINPSQ